jgi:DNA processing protein
MKQSKESPLYEATDKTHLHERPYINNGCNQKSGCQQAGSQPGDDLYWQWLCSCPILTRNEILALIRYFGSPREVYEAPLSAMAPFQKLRQKWVRSLISYKESCSLKKSADLLQQKGLKFCQRDDRHFPQKLRELLDCPHGLFYKGDLPDPDILSVAVIGARRCSHYGAKIAAYLGAQLARYKVQVISGMAAGIDGMAQRACIEEGGRSFAVLGSGADICYPPENSRLYRSLPDSGGIISEFGPATPPLPSHFPIRNRLICGLADAVIVVEARKKSGSLITVDLALDQGKDVYAVPGRFGDELSYGCNHLIEQGAGILTSVEQFLEEVCQRNGVTYNPLENENRHSDSNDDPACSRHSTTHAGLTQVEQLIIQKLELDAKGVDQLLEETGLTMSQLMEGILALQVRNAVQEVSRNRYARSSITLS